MSTQLIKDLSVATNAALDLLGFSEEMIKSRAEIVKHAASMFTNKIQNWIPELHFDCMIAGSTGDGITKYGESDIDIIQIYRNFLCLDNAQVESDLCIIQAITADSPPGYTKLNPLEMNSSTIAMDLLCFIAEYDLSRGQVFLLSNCMRNLVDAGRKIFSSYFAYDGTKRELRKQQGPSIPSTVHLKIPLMPYSDVSYETDCVTAMPYISSIVLDSWSKRDRHWPPQSVCKDIMDTETYVVPVGATCSENQNYEWRISFTIAETRRETAHQLKMLKRSTAV